MATVNDSTGSGTAHPVSGAASVTASSSSHPTSYDIARALIRKLGGDPTNAGLVRAVAIWLRFENSTVTGNNPWNIRGSGPCGSHYFGSNGPFHTYCSLDQGLDATASLLSINAHGYPAIKSAVRSGSGIGFLTAVAKSSWSAGHYGGGAKLVNAWNGSFNYNWTPAYRNGTPGSVNTGGGTLVNVETTIPDALAALAKIGIHVDANHRFTQEEADKIAKDLYHVSGDVAATIASRYKGHTIGEVIQASKDQASDPFGVGGISDALGAIGQVAGFFLDAENWLLIIELAAGVVILGWAAKNLFGSQLGTARPRAKSQSIESQVKQIAPDLTVTKSKIKES